ncbi:MAG: hypothetical protein P4L84_26435 [Isosphaeraceae bacterium]|nr:hypothetical protein [Isosphaeraceae bacterium]
MAASFGDFLERLYSSRARFDSLWAELRHSYDANLHKDVLFRNSLALGDRKPLYLSSSGPFSPGLVAESLSQIWMGSGERLRVEEARRSRGDNEHILTISDGCVAWTRTSKAPTVVVEEDARTSVGLLGAKRLFDVPTLRLMLEQVVAEPVATISTAGGDCVRLRATPRRDEVLWPHLLPFGADEYEFVADCERGVLVSIIGYSEKKPFEAYTVQHVLFDQVFDEALFSRSLGQDELVDRRLGAFVNKHEIATKSQNGVGIYVLDAGMESKLGIVAGHTKRDITMINVYGAKTIAKLTYVAPAFNESIWLFEQSETATDLKEMDEYFWREISREGVGLAISDPGEGRGWRIIRLVKDATKIALISRVSLDVLTEVSLSLVPLAENPWL